MDASVTDEEAREAEGETQRDQADVNVQSDRGQGEADHRDQEEDLGEAPGDSHDGTSAHGMLLPCMRGAPE